MADEGGVVVSSQVPFHDLCTLLEKIHISKGSDKKKHILKTFVNSWQETHKKLHGDVKTDDSFFPAMRLLLPQFDKERPAYGMKEAALAKHYIEILSIGKDSLDAKKLINFKAPTHAMKDAGDFAMVAYFVLKSRCPEKGSLSIKQVNDLLDKVAMGNMEHKKADIRNALQTLLRNTSALEQKWLIRIILKELKVGISEKSIFEVYHPDAMDVYNVCSILSKVCQDLRDPTVRKNDSEITLFSAFKPMLGQRADIEDVEKLMNEQAFIIETKLDGERFMIHKKNNMFKYFSRGSNEYTSTFGASPDEGCLTPFIATSFSRALNVLSPKASDPHVRASRHLLSRLSKVKSCILDGEMMAFNASNDMTFVSKAANIDFKSIKTYSDDSGLHPCFVVFDVLLVNDKSIASLPLKERLAYLEKVFTPIPGRIQLVESLNGETKQDVIKALNNAVDKYEEGLVVKSPLSIYQPNVRNGSGWLKIKPEYVDGLSDELDVLILGGYFGVGTRGGMVSHFLCGVAVPPESPDEKPTTFYSFCRVGSGYSINELKELCRQLHPHWKKFDPNRPPSSVVLATGFKEKPDVWIEPSKSKIVQIKAAEIVLSENYKAGQTLRFPRLEKIRDDKSWFECLDLNELEKLRTMAKGKLTYQHTTASDEPAPKKRKRTVNRVERPLTVARHFETADASAVQEKSKIFEDKEFYIVNGPPECGKVELEKGVLEAGGTIVQNPGADTFCVIAQKANVRVKNIIKQGTFDVVYASWLMECLDKDKLLPWLPSHMLYTSPKTDEKFALDYDMNGDSYTEDTDVESLKEIFQKIAEKQSMVKLTRNEIADVESRYFTEFPLGMFRQYRFYLDQFSEIGDPRTKLPNNTLDLQGLELRFHGGQLSEVFDEDVTHVIVNHNDLTRLPLIQQTSRNRLRKAHVVTEAWVTESIEAGRVLKERNYGP